MKNKILFGISIMIPVIFSYSSFFVNDVDAATCTIDKEYNWYSPTENDGSKDYEKPVIQYLSGTVYERALNSSDFKVTQDWTQDKRKEKWLVTEYNEPGCGETNSTETWEFEGYVSAPQESGTSTGTVSVNVDDNRKNTDGVITYVATDTMNGKSATPVYASTYWTKTVNITSSSQDTVNSDESAPTFVCNRIMGNGLSKPCATSDSEATTIADTEKNSVAGGFKSNATSPALNTLLNDPETRINYFELAGRQHVAQKESVRDRLNDSSPTISRTTSGGFYKSTYDYLFGQIIVASYVDPETGKSDVLSKKLYKLALVDVEVEKYSSGLYKEVYSDEINGVMDGVTCRIIYFGPDGDVKDCRSSVVVKDETSFISFDKKPFFEGENVLNEFERSGETQPQPGSPYQYYYYKIKHNDGFYEMSDDDGRVDIYVEDVFVESDVNRVLVMETHDRGQTTPKNYVRRDGITWKGVVEVYSQTPNVTCEATYATSPSTGAVRVKDCPLYISYDRDNIVVLDDGEASLKSGGSGPYTYTLGESIALDDNAREQQYDYIENGYMFSANVNYYYADNVNITVSDSYTYQDEPYPNITCEKFYKYGTFSCTDKMYIQSDTGQNKNMGGQRRIVFNYKNNIFEDPTTITRVYANSINITAPATSGKSGFRGFFYSTLLWQDGATKDISKLTGHWRSYVTSTGETVNYIGETWSGYTDAKGAQHIPRDINDFYIPDPISKHYTIESEYPKTQYNNGLYPGWSYVGDVYAPVKDTSPFNLIGINKILMYENTPFVHMVDKDSNGNQLINSFPELQAEAFNGIKNTPSSGFSPVLAFNNKTYQTGHFYDFIIEATWDNGDVERMDISQYPELTWRYRNAAGTWKYDYSDYPVAGHTFGMPESGLDHRLLLDGWNPIRFDLFSESSIRKPSGQNNSQYQKTYTASHAWAHEPVSLVIVGPSTTDNAAAEHEYKSYLNWVDGNGLNQSAQPVGDNSNPWGGNHTKPTEVTNKLTTEWWKDEKQLTTPVSGPLKTVLDDYEGTRMYRTIASSWGDNSRIEALPGYQYWDYVNSELDVLLSDVGPGPIDNCNSNVPEMNCQIPIDNPTDPNYRIPENDTVSLPRTIEYGIKFRVTGISQGSGE